MKTLTTTEANDILDDMLRINRDLSGNDQRSEYKIQFRKVINLCLETEDRAKIKDKCGFTINRMTDMVLWPVLTNVVLYALGETLRPSEGYTLSAALNRLVSAWNNDAKCRPAVRGSGISRGFHIAMLDGAAAQHALLNLRHQHSIGDLAHAAYLLGRVMFNAETTRDHNGGNELPQSALDIYLHNALDDYRDKGTEPSMFLKACTMVSDWSAAPHHDMWAHVKLLLSRVDIDSDELNYDKADSDIQTLVTMVMSGQAKPEPEAAPVAPVADPEPLVEDDGYERFDEPEPLDPSLSPAVDALIKQASSGSITGVGAYVDKFRKVNTAYHEAIAEIKRTRDKLSSMPVAGHTGAAKIDGNTLTYEVVKRKASELFTDARGRKSKKLNFEVNTLVWRDDSGNVVRHPDCPEIDETYKFRMHHLIKYLTAKIFGQHVWLHGHTGTGKTSFVEQVEARLGFPMERLNLDSNMERADIVGAIDIVVENGAPKSQFSEGMLPKAMQQPVVFLLDEIDAGRPDMLFVLQRALENKGLTLTEDGGRLVKPHPLFMFAGTANSRGQGDEHGWYQGVRPMNLAFLNRFGAFIEIGYMDEDDEKQFLKDAYPDLNTKMADQLAAFAQMVRASFMNGELSQTVSPRNLHAMAQYYQHFTVFMSHEDAWVEVIETCVSDAAPADNQQRIVELSRTVFGGGL